MIMARSQLFALLLSFLTTITAFGTAMATHDGKFSLELLTAGYNGVISQYTFTPPSALKASGLSINKTAGKSPSWISFSRKHSVIYATDEDTPGRVFALGRDLKVLGHESTGGSTGGDGPVSSEVVGNLLFIANYNSGSASVYELDEHTGVPLSDEPARTFQFHREPKGSTGPITSRQNQSYAHEVSADPEGRWVYVPDLGADKIHRLSIPHRGLGKAAAKEVKVIGETSVASGSGPRHISFHKSSQGLYAYLACELDTTLVAFEVDEDDGSLQTIGSAQRVLPPGRSAGGNSTYGHELTTSEVAVSPDGRFVYVGCRGDASEDHVAIFRRDETTGQVQWQDWTESGGRNLRHFSLSPDKQARYLAAGHQATGNVTILERDAMKGSLRKVATVNGIDKVAFAGFVPT